LNSDALNDADASLTAAVKHAMTEARAAQLPWSRAPLAGRQRLMRELRLLIAEHALLLAEVSASARGRPALESLISEVLPLSEACRFLERDAGRILAARRLGRRGLPIWLTGLRGEVHREPLGVVLIIGPGNYPLLLPGVQLAQALVAGNAVLLKPGLGGSPVARALIELIVRAGFDPPLVALLPESHEAARAAIMARPDKVLFTGSAATGEKILAQLAPHLIPATMELSGCDAVLVRADADLDLTVKALTFALLLNGGATCMSPKRVFVDRRIANELQGRLARAFPSSPGEDRGLARIGSQ
jgi:acyl-CoA reductase-like NAD-dependent aldehyde dehydrogenase